MPTPTFSTFMIKQIFEHLYRRDLSARKTAIALGISRGSITDYAQRAQATGLRTWADIAPLSEAELAARLVPASFGEQRRAQPDFEAIHCELKRKGMTLRLLWQEYFAANGHGRTLRYSQFCELYRQWQQKLKRSMRQTHRAGEKMFVDFAGPTLSLADGSMAHIFVAAMGASKLTYAVPLRSQKTEAWIEGMTGALHFMGGVPELIVPDQPRAIASKPCLYEPELSRSVQDFAEHYNTTVLPARPAHPQDKAIVESAVQVVERWILMRLRHFYLADLGAAQKAIADLLQELNERPFQKLAGTRRSHFEMLDQPALKLLPAQRYEMATYKKVKVHIDYHIEVDKHYYSVPQTLVQQYLEARVTQNLVEVLHAGKVVARHVRSLEPGRYTTVDEHMPAAHRAHKQWSPQRLIAWGQRIGPATGRWIEQMLERNKHPEQGYRRALGLISLHRQYEAQRIDAACAMALELGTYKYAHIKDILDNAREGMGVPASSPKPVLMHANVRGPAHYH
jgi:transposase